MLSVSLCGSVGCSSVSWLISTSGAGIISPTEAASDSAGVIPDTPRRISAVAMPSAYAVILVPPILNAFASTCAFPFSTAASGCDIAATDSSSDAKYIFSVAFSGVTLAIIEYVPSALSTTSSSMLSIATSSAAFSSPAPSNSIPDKVKVISIVLGFSISLKSATCFFTTTSSTMEPSHELIGSLVSNIPDDLSTLLGSVCVMVSSVPSTTILSYIILHAVSFDFLASPSVTS